MADARARRHDAEIVERALPPFQKAIAFAVALIFELDILLERLGRAEFVDDDGMVDHEIDRHERIDLLRIAFQLRHGVAHGGKIDDGGNAGEILHQHARGAEGDFALFSALVDQPFGDALDVLLRHRAPVFVAQQIFQQHLHRIGQRGHALQPVLLCRLQREIMVGLASHRELLAGFEAVVRRHGDHPAQVEGKTDL